ncbi:MAG TPA: hypothetical protein VK929_06605 [Longimicrobiales bacterium]|nr:hypothetical protein [Longimicrobiales bacterium]
MSEHEGSARTTASADLVREIEAVLGRRVDVLERENGRLQRHVRLMAGGVVLALALSTGMALLVNAERGRVADTVQARQFVLRDGADNVRAVLGSTPEGGVRFSMQDNAGSDRLRMTLLADGSPGLSLTDDEGRSRAVLAFLPDQTANLVFADRTGRTRAVLGLMPDESSTLVFANRAGETRVGLGVDAGGDAGLTVFDGPGAPVSEPVEADTTDIDETAVVATGTAPAGAARR